MRFDLLDEYSTLVPFGLGASRKRGLQEPAVSAKAAKRGTTANFASKRELLRKLLGALRQTVSSLIGTLSIKPQQSLTRLSAGPPLRIRLKSSGHVGHLSAAALTADLSSSRQSADNREEFP